jgi:hypothetical protein
MPAPHGARIIEAATESSESKSYEDLGDFDGQRRNEFPA